MTDFGGKTSIFSHPVYLFLRKFSLQDSRGGSVLIMSMHLNAPCIVSYPEMKRKHPSEQAGIPLAPV
ncbi:hypothetical protein D0215_12845 [Salmonella enterica subsp. enterica serovar Montevideo]|uniref:Uncharacterized protein n=1 Tax=Salmonella montevideo TaxID=115981 RepID=A0A608CK88_SALMO|nr:hypothetical protein [Salmonella enterica subsp. enterica serovar Montevideo]